LSLLIQSRPIPRCVVVGLNSQIGRNVIRVAVWTPIECHPINNRLLFCSCRLGCLTTRPDEVAPAPTLDEDDRIAHYFANANAAKLAASASAASLLTCHAANAFASALAGSLAMTALAVCP
jgi:hypothetical protein